MTLIKYNPEIFDHVYHLLNSQDEVLYRDATPELLPATGFVAFDSATPVAAAFLRMVEGGYAQIDTLVTNSILSSNSRHAGICQVTDAIIEHAKHLKLKGIVSYTSDPGVLVRAAAAGWSRPEQVIIALRLD